MKKTLTFILTAGVLLFLAGCATSSTAEKQARGPDGTVAYLVKVESNEPGVRIEANNNYIGRTPCILKIFGDKDGTFHNFGSYHYIVKAYPAKPGEQPQTKDFRTGGWFTQQDMIPTKIFFDFPPSPDSQETPTKTSLEPTPTAH